METKTRTRWILVLTGFVINLCLGTIYAWSVFRPSLHVEPYSLTSAQSVIPFSVFLLAFGVSFAFSGRMIGKVGPKKPALIGASLLGLGYILSYSIAILSDSSLWITIITFGLIAGTGCGFAYNPPIAVVGRWFPDKRGLAAGLTVMGFGLSALITAPLVSTMISVLGIAYTFMILGAVFMVVLLLLGALMKFPSTEWKPPSAKSTSTQKSWFAEIGDFTTRQMIKTNAFYVTWVVFLIGAGAGLMVIGYAKQIATDITGLTGDVEWLAVLSVSVLAVSNAFGRPLFGAICDKIGPRSTLFIMQGIQLLCLAILFPYSNSAPILYMAIILFAAAFGAYLAVMPTLVSYFFGAKNLGPNYGLYLSAYGVGGVVFPMLMSAIVGPNPTYTTYLQGFYTTAGLVLVAVLLALMMKPPKTSSNK